MRRLLIAFVALFPAAASAQSDIEAGLFTAAQQLPLVSQSVMVRIDGGEARIELTQVFANDGSDLAQADYRLHLPREATVTGFGFWHDGRLLRAELKERGQARQDHGAAAGDGRPTAMLQRDGTIHSFSVYPVLGGTLQEVEVSLTLPIATERGRSHVRLPLDSFLGHAKLASTVVVAVESRQPLKAIGVEGAPAKVTRRDMLGASLTFSAEDPVDIWWASEIPPLLTAAESVALDDGSQAVQLRLALNQGGARTDIKGVVLLVDGSFSMRRRSRALEQLVGRVREQASTPVTVVAVAENHVDVTADDPHETVRRVASGVAGFTTDWNDLVAAAERAGCSSGAMRCIVVTDPHTLVPPAERTLDALVLSDADELAHFEASIARDDLVFQPDVEPVAELFALADELVLPVLELVSITQNGETLEVLGSPRLRVARGGLLRLAVAAHSTSNLVLELEVEGRRVRRRVPIERLDPDDRFGRAVRRAHYRARLEDWTAEYRRTRDPELRQQIVAISLREGIPSDLTALHTAAPDRVLARTATAAPLLRLLGILLMAAGMTALGVWWRWQP